MPTDKFKINYDEEYDGLFIFRQAQKASYGIEWGNIDVSYNRQGKLVNLTLNDASKFLTNLTEKKITKADLSNINDCRMAITESTGIIYIHFTFFIKNKEPIEDTLTIKALNYKSPITKANSNN